MTVRKPFLMVLWAVLSLYIWLSLFQTGYSIQDHRQALLANEQSSVYFPASQSKTKTDTSPTQFLQVAGQQATEERVHLSAMSYRPSDDTYQLTLLGSEEALLNYYSQFEKKAPYHQLIGMSLALNPEEEGFKLSLSVQV